MKRNVFRSDVFIVLLPNLKVNFYLEEDVYTMEWTSVLLPRHTRRRANVCEGLETACTFFFFLIFFVHQIRLSHSWMVPRFLLEVNGYSI
jgi:hypothetical protein